MLQTVQQNEQQKLRYTYQRNGVYYFCYRVPKVIRNNFPYPSVIRISLQTRSASKAARMVKSLVEQFSDLKAYCMSKNIQQDLITHSTIFGTQTWDSGDDEADRLAAKEFREQNPKLYDPEYAIRLEEAKARNISTSLNTSTIEQPSILLSEAIERCFEWLEVRTAKGAKKPGMRPEIRRQTRNSFDYLLALIGDKPVSSIDKKDIETALETAVDLPLGNASPYNKMSAAERAEYAKKGETPEDDMISSKVVHLIYTDWHKLLSTFLVKQEGVLVSSPTEGLKPTFESQSFKPFTPHQAREIRDLVTRKLRQNQTNLSQAKSQGNIDKYQKSVDYCWLILFALYSGARKGDLMGLDFSAFKVDTEEGTGLHYVFVEEGKTTAATRRIPIHSQLIQLGILNYVQEFACLNSDNVIERRPVFKSFAKADNVTNYFRECMEELGIPKIHVETGKRHSFHSLRGTFIQNTVSNQQHKTEVVQRVVGHELNAIGITKKYIDDFPLLALSRVVESVDW